MNDSIMLYKMLNGDMVIGSIAKEYEAFARLQAEELGLPVPDVLYLRDPVEIKINETGAILRRWNILSKLNIVSVQPSAVMYLDIPSDLLVTKYLGLLNDEPDSPDIVEDDEDLDEPSFFH